MGQGDGDDASGSVPTPTPSRGAVRIGNLNRAAIEKSGGENDRAPVTGGRAPVRRGDNLVMNMKRAKHQAYIKKIKKMRQAYDILEAAVEKGSQMEMARSALTAMRIGRRNSIAQATAYLLGLGEGELGLEAAAGNLASKAARRIQRAVREWLSELKLLEVRMKLFAMDFKAQQKRPFQWQKPEKIRVIAPAEGFGPPEVTAPARCSSDFDDDDDEPPPPPPKKKRKPRKPKQQPSLPMLRPMPRKRRSSFDPSADDPLPWAVPVDTSNTAILSKPLPKKPPMFLMESVKAIPNLKPPRDTIEEMERSCASNNKLLRDTLEQNLIDERYRSVIDAGKATTAASRRYNKLARHLSRVSYERVKFDCQATMVIQLRDNGFLR